MRKAAAALLLACGVGLAQGTLPEQYPMPLIHTAKDHPAARVLLVDVEGMHAVDLARWVAAHPRGALAKLSARGVTYTNAHSAWGDPAAGLVGLVTGGTPISAGIVASDGYDRALSPGGAKCQSLGARLRLDAGAQADGEFDEALLPHDPARGCKPLRPHDLLKVNTIFEVAHGKIGRTGWAGASVAMMDLLRGPSGTGLDEACAFAHDAERVRAVLHWIDGKDCVGVRDVPVPALFGMSLTEVSMAQAAQGMGYVDGGEVMSPGLVKSFAAVDAELSLIMEELNATRLSDSTWVVIASAYGQGPMNPRRVRHVELSRVAAAAGEAATVHVSGGDVAMIWLTDRAMTPQAAKAYANQAAELGVQDIFWGPRLGLTLNLANSDSRMPDLVLQAASGIIWGPAGDTAIAASGGMSDEDTHIALLISGAQLAPGRLDKTLVPDTQLAPLLLRALGMEKFDLDALHLEHTPALPGIF